MAAMLTTMRVLARRALATPSTTRLVAPSSAVLMRHHARVSGMAFDSHRAFSSEKISMTFVDGEGNETAVTANEGETLLDVAQDNDIELEGACGGELACSTCHLIFEKAVYDELPEISEEEEDMLDLAWGLTDTSRLGCQIQVSKTLQGARIRVPDESDNLM